MPTCTGSFSDGKSLQSTAEIQVRSRPLISHVNLADKVRTHTTLGRAQVWDLKDIETVAMTPEESVHFRLDTHEGAIEWASALPRGKGVVFLPESQTPYRLSMFHQLECLDVVRAAMHDRQEHPSGPSTSQKAHFCLNYLRQSIQCHADAHLEMVRSEYGGRAVLPYTTRTDCKDWERVWAEAENNFDGWRVVD